MALIQELSHKERHFAQNLYFHPREYILKFIEDLSVDYRQKSNMVKKMAAVLAKNDHPSRTALLHENPNPQTF